MKRFFQPRFDEKLFYHPVAAPTCCECRQPVHAHKFTKEERVQALRESTQDISGFCVLRMADGVEHWLPTERVIALVGKVQRAPGVQAGRFPQWIFNKYPALAWFRDATLVETTDGAQYHQQLLDLIHPQREEKAS